MLQKHESTTYVLLKSILRYNHPRSNQSNLRKCFDLIMAAGADVNKTADNGATALVHVAEIGLTSYVNALIAAGADVNISDNEGFSPLMNAIWRRHTEVIESLIKAGADVNAASLRDEPGFESGVALRNKYPLIAAADCYGKESDKIIDMLISAGADVNRMSAQGGKTALHHICSLHSSKKLHTLRSLIAAGADVNKFDDFGGNPLSFAHDAACIRELLLAGAKVNMTTPNALQECLSRESPLQDSCMLLFAAGEVINGTTFMYKDSWGKEKKVVVPSYLLLDDIKLNLKHLCREAIRKHLLDVDPHTNLFSRIPSLGLPSLLNEYLLYDVSLCHPDNENDEQDKETGNDSDDQDGYEMTVMMTTEPAVKK